MEGGIRKGAEGFVSVVNLGAKRTVAVHACEAVRRHERSLGLAVTMSGCAPALPAGAMRCLRMSRGAYGDLGLHGPEVSRSGPAGQAIMPAGARSRGS